MAKPRLVQNAPFGGKEISSGFLSSGWYYANQTLLLGILLAIIGNILISISLNLQKWSHLRLMRQANQKPFYRSKLWWCGIILMGTGEMGNFAAYGFASIMVIAPLGNVAVIGGTVTIAGIFLLVTFAPSVTQELTTRKIQNDLVSWQFLIYVVVAVITFCILLYFHKRRKVNHIVVLLTMVALLASLNVISVKAVATMIALSVRSNMQLTYPVFYIMLILMVLTCVFQVKFLNQAMKLYSEAEVIPMNYVFFTISAVVAGAIFYQEFQDASLLSGFMFLFGCFLSFVGVFIITRKRGKECLTSFYIDYGHIPGKKMRSKIQPDSNNLSYGSLCYEGDSVKAQS
ncbi:NIPA-like protein 2 isoform X2 [Rhineura floridana]|uniref:NIPA-like protein 2 isoform X2 n=1 Tax=Rhineura floridana TaxID=261503 RepID=UPI002AC8737A|nr:NIPA-like protein 2 isoform X2 [Rhineura floridana]